MSSGFDAATTKTRVTLTAYTHTKSTEIEEFDEQMQDLLQGIKKVLEREIPNLRGSERTERCAYLKNRLARAKQVHRTIVVEIRDLPKDVSPDWEVKAKGYEGEIAQLMHDVEWAETTAKSGAAEEPKKRTVDEMAPKELTQQAMMVQDQTHEATSRTKRIVEQTLEVRRMSTDKIFLLFIFLTVIGLVVAIVLYILKKTGVVKFS
ncbi:hypothetical protein HDU98_011301 [Podochytrium sp. JEL0797]|nr:hypothetical protein HDU98_011301 [Podochytrium sp. JEL0797]